MMKDTLSTKKQHGLGPPGRCYAHTRVIFDAVQTLYSPVIFAGYRGVVGAAIVVTEPSPDTTASAMLCDIDAPETLQSHPGTTMDT